MWHIARVSIRPRVSESHMPGFIFALNFSRRANVAERNTREHSPEATAIFSRGEIHVNEPRLVFEKKKEKNQKNSREKG